jgi:hypothetical protein
VRPRLSPASVAIVCAGALIAPSSSLAASASPTASASAATSSKKKTKKPKRTTAQRVTALSQSLNRAKAAQRSAQKQLDALVKQQALIGDQITDATNKVTASVSLSSPAGILALLQDPSSGIPQLLDKVTAQATAGIRQLLASQEYAVAVVTVGGSIASPTLLVSPDIPDIGAPVTFGGSVPVIVPPGTNNEEVNVRVGAVSLESDGTGPSDPAFVADLNHFSVTPEGYTGNVGEATLSGGAAGVNITQLQNGQASQCTAGSNGCGAPVWSGSNPDLGFLPYWPVTAKLVDFGDKPGVTFDLNKMTNLSLGGRLASIGGGATGPIHVSTPSIRTGVSLLRADVTITVEDLSINPADPLA